MTKIKYIHQKNNKSTTGEGAVMLMFYWNSERRFIKLLCALKCLSCKLVWLFCLSQLWRNNWRAHPNFSFHIYQCDSSRQALVLNCGLLRVSLGYYFCFYAFFFFFSPRINPIWILGVSGGLKTLLLFDASCLTHYFLTLLIIKHVTFIFL